MQQQQQSSGIVVANKEDEIYESFDEAAQNSQQFDEAEQYAALKIQNVAIIQ